MTDAGLNVIPLERPPESCMAGMRERGDWSDGWAMLAFRGRPHWFYFVTDGETVLCETLCGRAYKGKAMAQVCEPGNFPRCKRCIAALRKRALTD
jgi:hypothetical protein